MNKDDVISKLGWFTQMESIPPLSDEFKRSKLSFLKISFISYKIMDLQLKKY